MIASEAKLQIGFIPLADAAALIVPVDKGFTAAEGLEVELLREVSWSNVRCVPEFCTAQSFCTLL